MGRHTKWRLERKESLAHKLTKEHTYRPFNRIERALILCIVIFGGSFFTLFGYYQLNVAPFLQNGHNDPFTQVWNGSITDSPTGPFGPPKLLSSFIHPGFSGSGTQTQAITVTSGNLIVVEVVSDATSCAGNSITVTDSQGNTIGGSGQYGHIGNQGSNNLVCVSVRWAFASATGADTITMLNGFGNGNAWQVLVYTGVATLPQSAGVFTGQFRTIAQVPGFATSGFTLLTFNPFAANSIVFEAWAQLTNFGCATANSGTTISVNKNCQTGINQIFSDYTWSSNSHPKVNQNITWSENGADSNGQNTIAAVAFEIPSLTPEPCPHGYTCSNAGVDASNLLNLFANSTNPGVAISTAPIDFSSAASKELFWFETWNNNTNYVAQPIGWFLTTNQTIPSQFNYNPLNDPSVVLLNIMYPLTANKNVYYNYQAKIPGQSLLTSSGAGTNPYPSCPQSSTLFICANSNINGGGFRDFSMTMNYTGTTGGTGSNGASLTCNESTPGPGPNTYDFCLAAYAPSPCTGITAPVACSTRVFPYLNVNAGPYYIGYWSAANQTGNILFGTSNSGAFDRRANMAFVWVPNPCGGTVVNCTQSTTDTGGFFGWLGHQIGNTFSVVGNTLGGLLSPVLSFGGSLLGSLYSGFVQAVGILIQTYVTVLNFLGNLLHLGNLGDLLLSLLITVGLLITNGLSTLVSWFTTVGTFLTSGWLTFLAGAASLVPTLLGIALTLWNFVFNANFNVKTLLFADYMICIIATYKKGLAGFFAWVSLNVFLFTFVFNIAWTVFDIITRPIHRAKETVDPVG